MHTTTTGSDEPLISYDNSDQRDAALLGTRAIERALGGFDEVEEALEDGRACINRWGGVDISGPESDEVRIIRDDVSIRVLVSDPRVVRRGGEPMLVWEARFSEKTPASVIAETIAQGLRLH